MSDITKIHLAPHQVWDGSDNARGHSTAIARLLWLRRMCLPSPPHNLFDMGCGEGAGILSWCTGDVRSDDLGIGGPELPIHGGCDVVPYFVETAQKNHPGCNFFLYDLQELTSGGRLPVSDYSYDVVVATEVIEHLYESQWRPFLKECYRIARRQILVTMPDGGLPDRADDWFPQAPNNTLYSGHQYEPCYDTWCRIMEEVFPEQVRCTKIFGFFTAHVLF